MHGKKHWRVSLRLGSEPREIGVYTKKSEANSSLRHITKTSIPVSEFDSVQAVPYDQYGNRDWKQSSVRFVAKHTSKGFGWRKGEGIR
jgi:hypothetical protein